MASIILTDLHLHLASDPATQLVLEQEGPARQFQPNAEVRGLAGGRRRTVKRAGTVEAVAVRVTATLTDLETLHSWAGQEMVMRDVSGRVWWGTVTVASDVPSGGVLTDRYDVDLTFERTTGTDEV